MDDAATSQVAIAIAHLPERQREALELRELQGLSYEEIAARMGTTWACVSQLIAHGRVNVYDEVRGTILASVAPSAGCERALGLIAAREDGELDDPSEAGWLDAHLKDCDRCRRGVEEMRAAAAAYRGETVGARSVESLGTTKATAAQPAATTQPFRGRRLPRRRLVTGAAVGLVLGLTGLAAALAGDDTTPSPAGPAADAASPRLSSGRADAKKPAMPRAAKKEQAAAKKRKQSRSEGSASVAASDGDAAYAPDAAAAPLSSPTPAPAPSRSGTPSKPGQDPTRPSAGAVVKSPTRPAKSPTGPAPQPTPTPSTAPEPAPAPAPEPPGSKLPTQSNKPAAPPGQSGDHPKK
ncbi:MAG TPA: sigma factor-like helix-turn-helix DNA-binding protein [Solirubrobacterales bacterium]|nr:sigma factor-like helix-turn-helix DNA-binding protein [Solirubrobacterales bacterium]